MKHPLLPETYSDAAMHRSLLEALRPYVLKEGTGIFNPEVKWDLRRARNDAEPLLKPAIWRHSMHAADGLVPDWEMAADSEEEVANLHTVIAGLFARQIQEGEPGFSLRRVEYRKGGEVAVVVAGPMLELLKKDYPEAQYREQEKISGEAKRSFLRRIEKLLKRGNDKG